MSQFKSPFVKLQWVFSKMTLVLFSAWMITALLNISFGYDTTSFGGVQSIPAFAKEFGGLKGDGTYALSASRASFMSSVAFAGKLLGAMTAPMPVEWFGHRYVLWVACLILFIGVILECTAHSVAQFVIGRCIVYYRYTLQARTMFHH